MDDLISRQAAIDALEKAMCEDGFRSSTGLIHKTTAYEIIRHLPSVQPEPCEDAVSRKAVYDAMVEKGQRSRRYKLGEIWELNGTEIREALDTVSSAQPEITLESAIDYLHSIGWMQEHDRILTESAQPEIVRCKDCQYQCKGQNECETWNLCGYRSWQYTPTTDEHFCSYAERREE